MNIFHYDRITGAFIGPGKAMLCPVTKEDWIIPANATTVQPPAITEGMAAVFADGAWTLAAILPDENEQPAPVSLEAYAADKRWHRENGGIVVGGVPVATDDRSKMMIMGARIKASDDAGFTTQWKTPDGFVTLDAAALIAISDAVLAHIDQCFGIEAGVLAAIDAGTITTAGQIDAAFAA